MTANPVSWSHETRWCLNSQIVRTVRASRNTNTSRSRLCIRWFNVALASSVMSVSAALHPAMNAQSVRSPTKIFQRSNVRTETVFVCIFLVDGADCLCDAEYGIKLYNEYDYINCLWHKQLLTGTAWSTQKWNRFSRYVVALSIDLAHNFFLPIWFRLAAATPCPFI